MSKTYQDAGRYGYHAGEAYDICMSRHKRYGSTNIDQAGLVGVIVRMGDKLSRIRNLLSKGGITMDTPPAEARRILNGLCRDDGASENKVEDDLLDLVNYAIIGRVWLEGCWGDSEKVYGPIYQQLEEESDA